jgi:hypothetical protein
MTTEVSGQMAGKKRMALLRASAEAAGIGLEAVLWDLGIDWPQIPVDLCDALIEVLARLPIGYRPMANG